MPRTTEIGIEADERYPSYELAGVTTGRLCIVVSTRKLKRWQKVIAAYNRVQKEMEAVREKADDQAHEALRGY